MKVHEYQAKQILTQYGVKIPEGRVAKNPTEAFEIAKQLGGRVAVKAQIHAGGRGKGGGVRIAQTAEEAQEIARNLIGSKLVTPQTGPEGREVQCVLIEEGLEIQKEFYLGIVIDRSQQRPVFMASREGGVEIEEVARKSPDLILKEYVHPAIGFQVFQARKLAFGLGLDATMVGQASRLMSALYQAFESTDASLVEVNPLVLTQGSELYALDAKMTFDDSALARHPEIVEMRDLSEEEPAEIEASRFQLNYIKLDGTVGCMVNGAGLAMATMDIIKLAGGSPANFLDVGGGADLEQVKNAFRILLSDENLKAVLINIFGGIMRCDVVAEGVVQAVKEVGVKVPVVVRLEGTNVEEGREILKTSGLDFVVATDMADAARKVVEGG
ncbi:MAG: ADP-forming succinate--CoA ligase subunit beta [Acidobacteria bacterium]|nr:ADP-forming succinate--CoA ligase subunit beta [Acidobacteriota bacterium]MCZ6769763.1 ADP-forming succinate--CoA ligase subunit beta [Acidobacteriota bacterium]